MTGLLDSAAGLFSGTPQAPQDPFEEQLRKRTLTALGLGLLAKSGPSRTPTSFGQAFGQAGMGAMGVADQARSQQMNTQLQQAKLDALRNPQQDTPSAIREYQFARQQGFDGSFREWEDRNQREPVENVTARTAIVGDETDPTTVLQSPDGRLFRTRPDGTREFLPSTAVQFVSLQGSREDVQRLPAARADDLTAERDWLGFQRNEISSMIGKLEDDPSLAGVPGSIRRAGQTVFGAGEDLASMFGQAGATDAANFINGARARAVSEARAGRMDPDQFEKLFDDPNFSELRLFENSLGFTLARLRVPDGRLLSTVIDRSIEDAQLTGATSSKDAIARLKAIDRQLKARVDGLNSRLGVESTKFSEMSRTDLLSVDPSSLGDEELDAYIKAMGQ